MLNFNLEAYPEVNKWYENIKNIPIVKEVHSGLQEYLDAISSASPKL